MAEDIHRTLVDEVLLGLRDGGLIRTGIDTELDRFRMHPIKAMVGFQISSYTSKSIEHTKLEGANESSNWMVH